MSTAATCTHSFPDPFPQPIDQIGDCRNCGITYQEAKAAMTTPSDELRAASARLRELIEAVPNDLWGDRAWHVEACSETATNECPCIVTQGEYKPFDQPQDPMIQYVADVETTGHANYIAAMHPGVGKALARWLDEEADRRDACFVAAIQIWGNAEHPDAVAWLTTGLGKGSARALDLARQINGGRR